MSKTIIQRATFKKVKPEDLYKVYLSSQKHSAAIGAKATVQAKKGGRFSAFGMLSGKFLLLEKGKRIVQTWRSKSWKKGEADSILILRFRKIKGGAVIDLIHDSVPDYDYRPIQEGWTQYYWRPWRKYLSKKK